MIDINKITESNDKVIFDFYADWCNPCKIMEPVLENIEKETDIKVVKVDVEKENDLATLFGIMSIPTMYFYKEGKKISEKIGVQTLETIVNIFA